MYYFRFKEISPRAEGYEGVDEMEPDKKTTKNIMKIAAFVVVLAFLLNHLGSLFAVLGGLIGLLSPLIIGSATAFIMNVPMRGFERYCFSRMRNRNLKRIFAIICAYFAVFLVIALVMGLVVPEIAVTIQNLVRDFPKRMHMMQCWLDELLKGNEELEIYVSTVWKSTEGYLLNAVNSLDFTGSGSIILKMTGAISGTVSAVVNFLMGFIFSIYILSQKEKLCRQAKRLLLVLLKERFANNIIDVVRLCNDTFQKFITGQCLEAVILGIIFFVCMTIFGMPYALTISVLIMLMSLIPVFGSFIGCFAGAFLILFVNPLQALIFVIMFLVIQQIEGNLIYPHVVGNSVGLPSIWVFVAVILGGNLFGIAGMLVFIPLCSVLYTLLKGWVYRAEEVKRKKKSQE